MGDAVIRLATFNIQHGRLPSGEIDIDVVARACAALDADVLALQEVDRNLRRSNDADTAAAVADACGMAHVFGPAIAVRGGEYGNALLARGVIDDVEVVALEDQEPRCGIVASVVIGATPMAVAATHLGLRGNARAQLPVLVDALRRRPGPRVLLGDLNLEPAEIAIDGFTRADTGPSWPTRVPRRALDHIFLDGLQETAAVVVPLPVSDHRALVVEVRCP